MFLPDMQQKVLNPWVQSFYEKNVLQQKCLISNSPHAHWMGKSDG